MYSSPVIGWVCLRCHCRHIELLVWAPETSRHRDCPVIPARARPRTATRAGGTCRGRRQAGRRRGTRSRRPDRGKARGRRRHSCATACRRGRRGRRPAGASVPGTHSMGTGRTAAGEVPARDRPATANTLTVNGAPSRCRHAAICRSSATSTNGGVEGNGGERVDRGAMRLTVGQRRSRPSPQSRNGQGSSAVAADHRIGPCRLVYALRTILSLSGTSTVVRHTPHVNALHPSVPVQVAVERADGILLPPPCFGYRRSSRMATGPR